MKHALLTRRLMQVSALALLTAVSACSKQEPAAQPPPAAEATQPAEFAQVQVHDTRDYFLNLASWVRALSGRWCSCAGRGCCHFRLGISQAASHLCPRFVVRALLFVHVVVVVRFVGFIRGGMSSEFCSSNR